MNNTLPSNAFDLCMLLYREMKDVKVSSDNKISGVLPESYDIEAIDDLLGDLYLYESVDHDSRKVCLAFAPNKFYKSLKSYLEDKKNRVGIASQFYLHNENYLHGVDDFPPKNEQLARYVQTIELIHKLTEISDLSIPEGSPEKLVFIANNKLYISLEYSDSDLKNLPDLDTLISEYINTNTHKAQKNSIIKTVLIEIAQGRPEISIKEILERFEEFKGRVRDNYNLYASEFSYEKVKSEIIKEKLEAITSLNKVFSDIQNQLLALPVALLLVRGQLNFNGDITVKNLIVWMSFLIFSFFMMILIRNQWSTLKAVKSEVDQHKEQLKSKYQAIAKRFEEDFYEVNSRYSKQRLTLVVIGIIIVVVFIIVTIIMAWYSGMEFATDVVNWLIAKYKLLSV